MLSAENATCRVREMTLDNMPSFARVIAEVKCREFGAELDETELAEIEKTELQTNATVPGARFFIAEVGSRVVGGAGIHSLPGKEDTCELRTMFLIPQSRSMGIGKQLLDQCIAAAKEIGFKHCYLETMKSMVRARKLYSKNGFRELPTPMRQTVPVYIDCWMMRDL